jgi:hypothetical protein
MMTKALFGVLLFAAAIASASETRMLADVDVHEAGRIEWHIGGARGALTITAAPSRSGDDLTYALLIDADADHPATLEDEARALSQVLDSLPARGIALQKIRVLRIWMHEITAQQRLVEAALGSEAWRVFAGAKGTRSFPKTIPLVAALIADHHVYREYEQTFTARNFTITPREVEGILVDPAAKIPRLNRTEMLPVPWQGLVWFSVRENEAGNEGADR